MIPSRRSLLRQRALQRYSNCPVGEAGDCNFRKRRMQAKALATGQEIDKGVR